MVEVADIFRLHGPDYRAKFADRMLPSHRRAMEDICRCRTEALGGQVGGGSFIGAPQDIYNLKNERAVSGFDVTHRNVNTILYEVPFFRGSRGAVRTPE